MTEPDFGIRWTPQMLVYAAARELLAGRSPADVAAFLARHEKQLGHE
jgi:hypothetical protein